MICKDIPETNISVELQASNSIDENDKKSIYFTSTVVMQTVRVVFSRTFLVCTFGTNAAALVVSVGKLFIPRRALICFARSVPLGRSLNTVAFLVTHSTRYVDQPVV